MAHRRACSLLILIYDTPTLRYMQEEKVEVSTSFVAWSNCTAMLARSVFSLACVIRGASEGQTRGE